MRKRWEGLAVILGIALVVAGIVILGLYDA